MWRWSLKEGPRVCWMFPELVLTLTLWRGRRGEGGKPRGGRMERLEILSELWRGMSGKPQLWGGCSCPGWCHGWCPGMSTTAPTKEGVAVAAAAKDVGAASGSSYGRGLGRLPGSA